MVQLPHAYRGVLEGLGLAERADVLHLFAARAARGFGDGFAAIILPAYLIEIGFDPFQIGLVATAALLGSAALTLAIGLMAPRYELRTLLLICAGLMVATGIVFPNAQHLLFIVMVAFIGTINPSTGDIGVHVPLEQSSLAQEAAPRERTRIFARYSFVGALSVAARLGQRFGLVNTMVFTHIPSSLCLILAAFLPSLAAVLALLLIRSALSQMDVPTRTSYVMAVVTPAERTAAAGITAVPRSLASAVSPALSGALLSTAFLGLPLVVCGVLKIVYDLSLLFSFRHIKPPEENEASQ